MEKSELLKYRRERRMLRSKVFMVLKFAQKGKETDYIQLLKDSLSPVQLEEVYDDLYYFIADKDIRDKVAEGSVPVSKLIDCELRSSSVKALKRKTMAVPFQFNTYVPHSHKEIATRQTKSHKHLRLAKTTAKGTSLDQLISQKKELERKEVKSLNYRWQLGQITEKPVTKTIKRENQPKQRPPKIRVRVPVDGPSLSSSPPIPKRIHLKQDRPQLYAELQSLVKSHSKALANEITLNL